MWLRTRPGLLAIPVLTHNLVNVGNSFFQKALTRRLTRRSGGRTCELGANDVRQVWVVSDG